MYLFDQLYIYIHSVSDILDILNYEGRGDHDVVVIMQATSLMKLK